jgi:hypothetical protein
MPRTPIPPSIQAEVVIKSRRKCPLCVFIDNNSSERPGQIAHINGDHSDSRFENLVWLCLEHHDKFDSKTSQTKNYTQIEVKTYRDKLYSIHSNSDYSKEDIELVRTYIRRYSKMFSHLFNHYSELGYSIDHNIFDYLAEIRDYWYTSQLRSFNPFIRGLQDEIANNIVGLISIYEINMYDLVGDWIKFDNARFSNEILIQKRLQAKSFVDSIASLYQRLETIAVS